MNVYITKMNGAAWNPLQDRQWMTAEIAHQLGCREMGIYCYDGNAESVDSLNGRLDGIIAGLSWGEDVVVCQFPTGNSSRYEWELVNRLKVYQIKVIIFIHDLEALVCESGRAGLAEKIRLYNQAEVLIVPSLAFRQFLSDNGIRKEMKFVIQEMWDYPVDMNFFHTPRFCREIHYTGNGFAGMGDWGRGVALKIYAHSSEEKQNVHYVGELSRGELFSALSRGGFGLVWYQDADSRQIMEYGTSFELARYLAAEIPVIVPTGISSQTLIEKNHLGLVVNSIDEAAAAVEAMTEGVYQRYVQDVRQFAQALRGGYYTKKCLIDAVEAVCRKDAGEITSPAKVYDPGVCEFTFTVLKESYGESLALSWSYRGETDGFLIYDTLGKLIYETRNVHQHYVNIKGHGAESGFIVKAYMDTMKGKLSIQESKPTYLQMRQYEHPKASLIIPAYNAEGYISRSIDTALAQSFSDLEIIIVDDGSTDRTPEIIDWYAEKYSNVVVIHKENGGVAAARNTGIEYAGGEYIGFMDNDDMIHPEMITSLHNPAKKYDCDVAITSVYKIDGGDYRIYIKFYMSEDVVVVRTEDFFQMLFGQGTRTASEIWNKLYRSSLLKKHPIPAILGDDVAWTPYVLSYADKICYRGECYYEWDRTIRESTLVNEWIGKSKDELLDFYKNAVIFYIENGNPELMELLKEQAKRELLSCGQMFADGRYEDFWHQIEEKF